MSQRNLGLVLEAQGERASGEEGKRLLGEAVTAYRAALEVYTREQLPRLWAVAQSNLGSVLSDQGKRANGEDGQRLLGEAVTAYRAALEVYTREQLPQEWAMTQNNLGTALRNQGKRASGEEAPRLLADAVTAFRAALEVRTREQWPQDWARTCKSNLGLALRNQGERASGEEAARLLGEAVVAFRAIAMAREQDLGSDNPSTLKAWNSWPGLWWSKRNIRKLELLIQPVVATMKRVLDRKAQWRLRRGTLSGRPCADKASCKKRKPSIARCWRSRSACWGWKTPRPYPVATIWRSHSKRKRSMRRRSRWPGARKRVS